MKPKQDDHNLTDRGAELLKQGRGRNSIPRVVSLLVLVGVLVLTSVLLFRVMALFVVPLFLAGVLVVVFEPVFKWFRRKLRGRAALASLATTTLILFSVFTPCAVLAWRSIHEYNALVEAHPGGLPTEAAIARAMGKKPPEDASPPDFWHSFDNPPAESPQATLSIWYEWLMDRPLDNYEVERIRSRVVDYLKRDGDELAVGGLKAAGALMLGLVVMTVAVYYFFADGPEMVNTLMHLSPLDDVYEQELLERFAQVSRAVVIATVLSAVVQGVLAGIGYWFTLDSDWPIFLLTMLTMVMAMVPFLGATAVWGLVAVALFIQGHTGSAVGLAIYGAAIVSTIDNVIKPLVLHGQSNLHPLLALLSVLGGITVLGPIGILVGPMLVVFVQSLLVMLRKELDSLAEEAGEAADPAPASSPIGGS